LTTHAPLIGALEVRRPFPARLGPKGALLYKLVAQAGRNIEDALGRAGATLSDIVSVRQWLTHAADIPAYAALRS
jgi:enamine deaminase RidA (YjgF/YER057c/UK114 family)